MGLTKRTYDELSMGYQALLFCSDEKTARTVTQILSELDFAVIASNEPFAAVKKLMGEPFDAVVVDCDNEQNATLLFKSARNAANNQTSLAVAVVDGQAEVAKAFRMGANLVLTKPINAEQAKGTLRVARGLLRKSRAAKAVSTAVGAETAALEPTELLANAAAASASPHSAEPLESVAVASAEMTEGDTTLVEAKSETASDAIAAKSSVTEIHVAPSAAGFGSGAASAPAPAREPQVSEPASDSSINDETSSNTSEAKSTVAAKTDAHSDASANKVKSAAPKAGGSKKTLLAVAAIALIAVAGYEAWMQWGQAGHSTPASVPTPAVKPATNPAVAPNTAPSAVPDGTSSAPSATVAPAPAAADSSSAPVTDKPSASSPQPVPEKISEGLLLTGPAPVYPPDALKARLEGVVQLSATVNQSGDVSALKLVSGDPQLARAATNAVKQWKYKPYLQGGVPVEMQTPVTITFKLPQ